MTSLLLSCQTCVCRNKTRLLSWQKYAKTCVCRNTFCYDKRNFVVTKGLSWQAYFCHDEAFVTRKMILVAAPASDRIWQGVVRIGTLVHQWQSVLRVYHSFIMTKGCLSWQTSVCRDKCFVATNIVLSWQAYFCCDKNFVVKVFLTCGSSRQWQNMAVSREDRYAGTPVAVSTRSVPRRRFLA